MKIGLDTNVMLRLVVDDDDAQQQRAIEVLDDAELVAISVHALCEFAWVLDRRYGARRADVSAAIRRLIAMRNVVANRSAIAAGLNVLDAGGDFAEWCDRLRWAVVGCGDLRVIRPARRETSRSPGYRCHPFVRLVAQPGRAESRRRA